MKTLKIEIPKGYEIDQKKSTFEKIVFKEIKKELPKSWEELIRIEGYYVNTSSNVSNASGGAMEANKNVFATLEQAEAAIALAQLSQLRDAYRQGWKPDWQNAGTKKYVIFYEESHFKIDYWYTRQYFLSFESAAIAQEFLANFEDLIKKASLLMS
jgi:flagellar biosynthesis chaperone FliJ